MSVPRATSYGPGVPRPTGPPVTPVHSPQLSFSSTPSSRARTPGSHDVLTLHEYRRKQKQPELERSSPAVRGTKRIKRKPATPDLHAAERLPLIQSPESSTSPELEADSRPSLESAYRAPLLFGPSQAAPSLESLPRTHAPSLHSLALSEPSRPSLDYPSTDEAEYFYPSHDRFEEFKNSLKPIRRLPRPNSNSDSQTNSSTISLSRFPLPPKSPRPPALSRLRESHDIDPLRFHGPEGPVSSQAAPHPLQPEHPASFASRVWHGSGAPSDSRSAGTSAGRCMTHVSTPSRAEFPPATGDVPSAGSDPSRGSARVVSDPVVNYRFDSSNPRDPRSLPQTVVHYRGASFDVVNPHPSLILSSIETPAEIDAELSDYFDSGDEMDTEGRSRALSAPGRATPIRPLYADFPSAWRSITSSKVETSIPASPTILPPPAVYNPTLPLSTRSEPYDLGLHSPRTPKTPKTYKGDKKEPWSPSLFRKFSKYLPRRKENAQPRAPDAPEEGTELLALTSLGIPPASVPPVRSAAYETIGSALAGSDIDIEHARQDEEISILGDSVPDNYDAESVYPSSIINARSSSLRPESLYAEANSNRRSVPFGRLIGETDYSTEVDLESYAYSWDRSDFVNRQSGVQDTLQPASPFREPKDSTVDSILNRYDDHETGDLSNPSLLDLIRSEDEDTIRLSGADHSGSGRSSQRLGEFSNLVTKPAHNASSSPYFISAESSIGSEVSSPQTPEEATFLPFNLTPRERPGAPPRAPLPLEPPLDLRRPNPPYAYRSRPSAVSDMFSKASSYGDTRNLLMLSPSINWARGDTATDLRQAVPAHTSVGALPAAGDHAAAAFGRDLSSFETPSPSENQDPSSLIDRELGRLSQPVVSRFTSSSDELPEPMDNMRSDPDAGPSTTKQSYHVRHSSDEQKSSQPIIPTIWRGGSPVGRVQTHDSERSASEVAGRGGSDSDGSDPRVLTVRNGMPEKSSSTISHRGEEDEDWETVDDPSRPSLDRRQNYLNSTTFAGFDSVSAIAEEYVIHPGDPRYSHSYRSLYSGDRSAEQFLFPSYDFPDGAQFPYRNALTPPRENPYQHPQPLTPSHANPFRSSPPSLGLHDASVERNSESSDGGPVSTRPDVEAGDLPTEADPSSHERAASANPGAAFPFELSPQRAQMLLSSGPNEEILYDHPNPYARHEMQASSSHDLEDLINGPPAHINSPLGHDTFNGHVYSCRSPTSNPGKAPVRGNQGPTRQPIVSSPLAHARSPPPPHQSPFATPGSQPRRASVQGQTKLRDLVLNSQTSLRSDTTRVSQFMKSDRVLSQGSNAPFPERNSIHRPLEELSSPSPSRAISGVQSTRFPVRPQRPADDEQPTLRRSQRDSSLYDPAIDSEHQRWVYTKKRRLSWAIFGFFLIAPPLLLLLGYGYCDRVICFVTKGEIGSCARTTKRAALWVGWISCVTTLTALVVGLILLRVFNAIG